MVILIVNLFFGLDRAQSTIVIYSNSKELTNRNVLVT